jgi:peroxidase
MLAESYHSPWDVDLFPGAMVELPVRGGLVGPTFACLIGQTFRNLRRGDRFWYENPDQFTTAQLQAIRNISLARVICDTSDGIQSMQPIIFLAPHLQK